MAGEIVVRTTIPTLASTLKRLEGDMSTKVDKFWVSVENYLERERLKRFQRSVGPSGRAWKGASRLTVQMRKKGRKGSKRGSKTMIDSGKLMKDMHARVMDNRKTLEMYTRLPYSGIMQNGAFMRITSKQAWWMALHLYSGVKGKRKASKKTMREAYPMARALEGQYLKIPKREHMGFSRKDIRTLPWIWVEWFAKITG